MNWDSPKWLVFSETLNALYTSGPCGPQKGSVVRAEDKRLGLPGKVTMTRQVATEVALSHLRETTAGVENTPSLASCRARELKSLREV